MVYLIASKDVARRASAGGGVQILHACKLWCESCSDVACALIALPKSTLCIEPQGEKINS